MSSFSFTIPGQPMSWNRAYRQRTVQVRDRLGQPVHDDRGRLKTRPGLFKTKDAEAYQDTVRWLAKVSVPKDWAATEAIVGYHFRLARDIDCDNVMKMIHDALAEALNVNDRTFYPVVFDKTTGNASPYVEVWVYDRSIWRVRIDAA